MCQAGGGKELGSKNIYYSFGHWEVTGHIHEKKFNIRSATHIEVEVCRQSCLVYWARREKGAQTEKEPTATFYQKPSLLERKKTGGGREAQIV